MFFGMYIYIYNKPKYIINNIKKSPGQRPSGVLDPGYQPLILKFVKFIKCGGGTPLRVPSLTRLARCWNSAVTFKNGQNAWEVLQKWSLGRFL